MQREFGGAPQPLPEEEIVGLIKEEDALLQKSKRTPAEQARLDNLEATIDVQRGLMPIAKWGQLSETALAESRPEGFTYPEEWKTNPADLHQRIEERIEEGEMDDSDTK